LQLAIDQYFERFVKPYFPKDGLGGYEQYLLQNKIAASDLIEGSHRFEQKYVTFEYTLSTKDQLDKKPNVNTKTDSTDDSSTQKDVNIPLLAKSSFRRFPSVDFPETEIPVIKIAPARIESSPTKYPLIS